MIKNIYVSEENQKYINAFISVAKILEPSIDFNDVLYNKHAKENGGVSVEIAVSGFTENGMMVQVTKELRNPLNGEEIVVRYVNTNNAKVVKERGVWACAFNWTALMATWKVDKERSK